MFIGAGTNDPIIRREETEELESLLREAGAEVTMLWGNQGHRLSSAEAEAARDWLKQQSNFRQV
ncbi:putative hydrolase MhqD [compost metagenome]